MLNKQECINKILANADVIMNEYGVRSLRLFGSVARNEQVGGCGQSPLLCPVSCNVRPPYQRRSSGESHRGVMAMFGEHYVRTEITEKGHIGYKIFF